MAGQTFAELQAQFRTIWPAVTLRSIGDVERTIGSASRCECWLSKRIPRVRVRSQTHTAGTTGIS